MDSGFLIKSLLGMEKVLNAQQKVVFDGCMSPPVTGGVSTDSWTIEVKTVQFVFVCACCPCMHIYMSTYAQNTRCFCWLLNQRIVRRMPLRCVHVPEPQQTKCLADTIISFVCVNSINFSNLCGSCCFPFCIVNWVGTKLSVLHTKKKETS